MSQTQMKEHVTFSSFRPHPKNSKFDQFDILIDGKVHSIHSVDMSSVMGSAHEEFLYAQAKRLAQQTLSQ